MSEVELGLVVAAILYGFRHGFDVDHLAALSDITGSSGGRDRALALSTLYIVGHAVVVLVLGGAAVIFGAYIPRSLDAAMDAVIGVTLIALGAYLLLSLIRHGGALRMRSRWMLVIDGIRVLVRRARPGHEPVVIEHSHPHSHDAPHDHEHIDAFSVGTVAPARVAVATTHTHVHRHVATMPSDPLRSYSAPAAFGIGMIHGVGAETPSQILLFASAAGASTTVAGLSVVAAFIAGLVVANTAVALVTAMGFGRGRRGSRLYLAIAIATAAFSLYLGASYILGGAPRIPGL